MTNENQNSKKKAIEKAQAFIVQQIKAGANKDTITTRFEEMGMAHDQATELVDTLYPAIMQVAKDQEFTSETLSPAVIGGTLAAVVGGAIWGAIVIFTGYEVGFVAWGIGFLSGGAVVLFARGRRGAPLQVLAVISSIAGIGIGKYVAFYHFLKKAVMEEYGTESAENLSIFSGDVFNFFLENASTFLGGFDILWIILAVITAWRIPQGLGIKPLANVHL